MTLRAFSEFLELPVSLWAFGESVSPQLVHGTSVSLCVFSVSVEPSVSLRALSKWILQMDGPSKWMGPLDFQ